MFWRAFLLALLVGACVGASDRIIAGADAVAGQFPWQVAIEITAGGSGFLCGGSIVAPKYILTAAHCVRDLDQNDQNENPANINVIPGVDRRITTGQRNVNRYFVHPSYSSATPQDDRIDIAVLELTAPLALSADVAVVPLCQAGECGAAGSALLVSGFGQRTSEVTSSVSDILQWADQTAVLQSACALKWEANFGCVNCLPKTNVCAQSNPVTANPSKDSCFGDSGGPLVQVFAGGAKKLWGVVSTGTVANGQTPACGKLGEFGVYISVPANAAWIGNATSGGLNTTAIDNACVASNSCSTSRPATRPPSTTGGTGATLLPAALALQLLAVAAVFAAL